jgi:hypothetical protein
VVTLRWALACAWIVACGGSQRDASKPGDDHDEGAGLLAQASTSLVSGKAGSDDVAANPKRRRPVSAYGGAVYGGDPYGGSMYGDPFGGTSYARWTAPVWSYANATRPPHYVVTDTGLDASIEGTVTWPGAVPADLKTPCGPLAPIHIGAQHGVRGVIVYIERITTGRGIGGPGRAQLGGVIAKHGCALGPTAQLAVPMPSSVAIHGDAQRARVRITPPDGPGKVYDLQEGGLVTAEVKPGVTRIDGEDGKLAAAWVIGIQSPYFSVTDDGGRFRIEQLAAGTYDVAFWQPPIAAMNGDGTFAYGAPIVVHRSIHVDAKQTAKVTVVLPPR